MVWRGRVGKEFAGQVFVSTRGTQGLEDIADDVQLAALGIPTTQVIDMVNWWLRIKTPPNVLAKQIELVADYDNNTPPNQIGSHFALTTGVPGQGTPEMLSITSVASVNGHSLGGYLATAFTRLFGNQSGVQSVNTFNSAGFSNAAANNISNSYNQIARLLGLSGSFEAVGNIQTNYYGQNGINVTTNSLADARLPGFQQYGSRKALYQEDLLSDPISNHYIYKLTDYLAVGKALEQLDSNLNLDKLNELIKAGSNAMKASYEGVLDSVRKSLLGADTATTPAGDVSNSTYPRPTYHVTLADLQNSLVFKSLEGQLLIRLSSTNLAAAARNDFSALVALQDLSPIWITGKDAAADAKLKTIWQASRAEDYAAWEKDKSEETPITFTDEWIKDRAALLNAIIIRNKQDNTSGTVSDAAAPVSHPHTFQWYGADPLPGELLPRLATLTHFPHNGLATSKEQFFSFGDDSNNVITGTKEINFGDRLYGGAGNDTITAGKGDDYIEGGAGDDTLLDGGEGDDKILGGAGNDKLVGDKGNDQLIGGTGNDEIIGGDNDDILIGGEGTDTLTAGSGNDILIGGTGDDTLDGGDGFDFLNGGAGKDSLTGVAGNDYLYDQGGTGSSEQSTLKGDSGNDILEIKGGTATNLLGGGAGNDIIKGGAGNNSLDGDEGNDFLQGTAGQSVLGGGELLITINSIALRADNTPGKCLKGFKYRRKTSLQRCKRSNYKPDWQFPGINTAQSATKLVVIN